MKSYSAVVLAALAATASAVKFTNPSVKPEPGKPFELTWTEAEGPVTINLKGGPSRNLETIETLASNVNGDSTEVTLDPSKFPTGEYAFEIIDSGDTGNPNYSVQFQFEGDAEATSESASASETSSASTSASTSGSTTASSTSASRTASASASESEESSGSPSRTPSPEEEDDEDVPDSGSARNMSPIALIFVTAAAMLYFN